MSAAGPRHDPLDDDLPAGSDEQRRRTALRADAVELDPAVGATDPVVSLRTVADGCHVVALAGVFDADAVVRLEGCLADLRRHGLVELVLDLRELVAYPPRLARVVGHLRIRCLVDGVRIELHGLPDDLRDELLR